MTRICQITLSEPEAMFVADATILLNAILSGNTTVIHNINRLISEAIRDKCYQMEDGISVNKKIMALAEKWGK